MSACASQERSFAAAANGGIPPIALDPACWGNGKNGLDAVDRCVGHERLLHPIWSNCSACSDHFTENGSSARAKVTSVPCCPSRIVASLVELPGGPGLWTAAVALPLLAFAWRSGARPLHLALGGVIGLVAAAGWAGTSVLLFYEFDPLPVQSMAFTLPWSETLFWTIASTAVQPTFGVGLVGGVLGGAFLSALLRRELRLESFEAPAQTLRYGLGAALMGVGGVLAGGCTVGAGLAGGATLSVAALIVLFSIVIGGRLSHAALGGISLANGARQAA